MACSAIAYQDLKEREVVWILFPVLALLLSALHIFNTQWHQFLLFSLTNILLVSGVLLLLFLYTKHLTRKKFINTSFGLGDLLLFYAFSLGFPTVTFVLLFVGAILFSLMVFVLFKTRYNPNTVPLAGLMGIFIITVFIVSFLPNIPSLYII
mgnify:CR=1 FL=1